MGPTRVGLQHATDVPDHVDHVSSSLAVSSHVERHASRTLDAPSAMANVKLVIDVSEIGLLQSLARTRTRLVISTLIALAATYGLGLASAHYILNVSQSVVLNMFLITGNMFFVLISAFLSTVLVGDLFFTGPWREAVFLEQADRDPSKAPVSSHNGEFMVLLVALIVGNAFGLNAATGGFLDTYHAEGYFRVLLRSERPERRISAFEEMTDQINYYLWDREGVQTLVTDTFDDSNADVREMAAWSAGRMEMQSARTSLIDVLEEDASAEVRAEAATALGKLGIEPRARKTLERTLNRTDSSTVRIGVLRGLGLMGAPDSVDAITPFFESSNETVAIHAFWAIRKIGSSDAREAVRAVIDGEPSFVRKCAAYDALKKVAVDRDVLWARRQFQTTDGSEECEERAWQERDDTKHYILVGDTFRVKLIKIVANHAAFEHQDWFQRIVNDDNEPWRVREVANEVIRQIKDANR
jgi:hypothetical protein